MTSVLPRFKLAEGEGGEKTADYQYGSFGIPWGGWGQAGAAERRKYLVRP